MGSPGFYGSNWSSYDADPVDFTLRFTAAAAGAVPAAWTKGGGSGVTGGPVASVTKGANGAYDVVLTEIWADYISIKGFVVQASYAAAGACQVQVTGVNLATKTINLTVTNAAGASTALTSGDVITVNFSMQQQANY